MLKYPFFLLLSMLWYFKGYAQSDTIAYWDSGGEFNATFQQVTLQNWAGGGRSTIAVGGVANFFLVYDDTVKHRWENTLELNYGISRVGGADNPFAKTNDNILFISRYGRKLSPRFYLSALADFRSQMTQGFRYEEINDSTVNTTKIAEFMSPGFLVTSLGITYSPTRKTLLKKERKKDQGEEEKEQMQKKRDRFSVTLSPFSGKFTFVLDDALVRLDRYGTEGENVRAEVGSSITASVRKSLGENILISSNLNFFSAYEHPLNIDTNFETLLVLKVNQYISANVALQLIYDDDINIRREDGTTGPALQLQNAINVGLSYGF